MVNPRLGSVPYLMRTKMIDTGLGKPVFYVDAVIESLSPESFREIGFSK